MRRNLQLVRGFDPERGIYGDCFRTAISCLLDVEPQDVPHWFVNGGHDGIGAEVNTWLAERGLAYIEMNVQGVGDSWREHFKQERADFWHLLVIKSPRHDCDHVVVARNGVPVWCPTVGELPADYPCVERSYGLLIRTGLVPAQGGAQ